MSEAEPPDYFDHLGVKHDWIPAWEEPPEENTYRDLNYHRRKAAFLRAHDIRKFEIELYWKRAGYFWLMQAAIFAALGLIWKADETGELGLLPLGLAGIGFLTAVAAWFASEGSKFWQENWEKHIDQLEDEHEGALLKTVWIGEDGVRWSVSGTNGWLNIFFAIFWLSVFIGVLVDSANWSLLTFSTGSSVTFDWRAGKAIAIALATVLGFVLLWRRGTRLEGKRHWPRLITLRKSAPYVISRRPSE